MHDCLKQFQPTTLLLSDAGEVPTELQYARTGKFNHPEYGVFEITAPMLSEMASNFSKNILQVDPAFDYFHENAKVAAGWPRAFELRENGTQLWATNIEWTPQGQERVASKELRYFSPEFKFVWTHPETGQKFSNVIFGGGLTNRPFIRGMEPLISLSEVETMLLADGAQLKKDLQARSKHYGIEITADAHLTPPAGSPENPDDYADPVNFKYPIGDKAHAANAHARFKQAASVYKSKGSKAKVFERIVRKELALGVKPSFNPNDALDAMLPEDLKSKLDSTKKLSDIPGGNTYMDPKDQKIAELEKELAALKAKMASEASAEGDQGAQLAQMKADNAKMCSEVKALQDKVDASEKAVKLAEKESKFTVLLSEGKACVAQKEAFMAGDMEKFVALSQPMNLNPKGNGGEASGTTDREERIIKLAEEKVKANPKLDYGVAMSQANKEIK